MATSLKGYIYSISYRVYHVYDTVSTIVDSA